MSLVAGVESLHKVFCKVNVNAVTHIFPTLQRWLEQFRLHCWLDSISSANFLAEVAEVLTNNEDEML